ncbi:hypothetical protein HN018_02890 [Lichenicola cladoniae]|uniref:Uncharacterized protein n=1 Tax=Lichenicola cladoniae TaxID=1484109 RepID=A0A6M8HLA7_9PROT|nr:hypothetical protein [Lichenicola cladoniae]NPD68919.1 hypothetical protein [Acetobacteraceae bacterium]QKE89135.1 hypothetical protein HN018_02890 [Lichenicola cladoniae]
MTLEIGKSGSKALLAAVRQLATTEVLVGFPAGEAPREDGSKLTNAAIAYIQDNGAPEANIPARPFMRPGIEAVKDQIAVALGKAGRAAINGDSAGVQAGLTAAGFAAEGSIKERITDGIDPPLAAATLAARKRKGFQGETPLLRSGELRNAVRHVLRDRGGWVIYVRKR